MIQTRKLTAAAAAVLFVLAAFQAKADHTNLVQNISIRLSGITQGGTRTNGNVVTTSINGAHVGTGAAEVAAHHAGQVQRVQRQVQLVREPRGGRQAHAGDDDARTTSSTGSTVVRSTVAGRSRRPIAHSAAIVPSS